MGGALCVYGLRTVQRGLEVLTEVPGRIPANPLGPVGSLGPQPGGVRMKSLEQAVERAVDDIIAEVTTVVMADALHWQRLEAAATRLRKAARELRRGTSCGDR
jgi:hypothetical protein